MSFIKRKKVILIISLIILFLPILIKKESIKINLKNIPNKIINVVHNKKEEYLLTLNIPKINLSKKVYPINNKLNDINKNIEILLSSNVEANNFILAAHSGTNSNAYFNDLYQLEINDLIFINYKDSIYTYCVNDIYYIDKTGYLELTFPLENTLILITCSRKYTNKQIIVTSRLINKK